MATLSLIASEIVLRKRKYRQSAGVLHLASSPSPSCESSSESEYEDGTNSQPTEPMNRIKVKPNAEKTRPFRCTSDGCSKAYTKPSRLAEHQRTHTGERPFSCPICDKSYLRESHLQAHARSHLPYSSRPFVCEAEGCEKRFWTTQHLRIHTDLHSGEKPFKCTKESCSEAFTKHHQLREHICTAHAPPGTKPYMCEHDGCTMSFLTNQKLRTHLKTHDDRRYACSHMSCLTDSNTVYYATWTALQHHVRNAHPPTCPYASCSGKIFSAQKGLRAHLKIHEQRTVEEGLQQFGSDAEDDSEEHPKKRRRGGEVGRDWVCDVEGCKKDFKSKKALTNHRNVNHLGRRDFVCPRDDCKRAFGYKHLLQRHLAKVHAPDTDSSDRSSSDGESQNRGATYTVARQEIDEITGKSYTIRSKQMMTKANTLRCPYPDLNGLSTDTHSLAGCSKTCEYVFSRAYDFRRHLQSGHGIIVDKDDVDRWAKVAKKAKAASL